MEILLIMFLAPLAIVAGIGVVVVLAWRGAKKAIRSLSDFPKMDP